MQLALALAREAAAEGEVPVGAVVMQLGYIATCWAFLYFLYRKNVFLKV